MRASRVGAVAKVLAFLGAALLFASGTCFLFLGDMLGGGQGTAPTLPWTIGVVLIVAGVLAVVAALGLGRGPRD